MQFRERYLWLMVWTHGLCVFLIKVIGLGLRLLKWVGLCIELGLFPNRLDWPTSSISLISSYLLLNWNLPIKLEPSTLTTNATAATGDLLSPNRTHGRNLTFLFFSALGCDRFGFLDLVWGFGFDWKFDLGLGFRCLGFQMVVAVSFWFGVWFGV